MACTQTHQIHISSLNATEHTNLSTSQPPASLSPLLLSSASRCDPALRTMMTRWGAEFWSSHGQELADHWGGGGGGSLEHISTLIP
jgi:hypothetical protein